MNFTIAAVTAGLAAAGLGLAGPAYAAPTGPGNANDAISQLTQQGNQVIVKRLSDTPLSRASVVSVHPGSGAASALGQVVYVAVR